MNFIGTLYFFMCPRKMLTALHFEFDSRCRRSCNPCSGFDSVFEVLVSYLVSVLYRFVPFRILDSPLQEDNPGLKSQFKK